MSNGTNRAPTPQDAAPDRLALEHRDHVCGRVGHCSAECPVPPAGSWRRLQLASIPSPDPVTTRRLRVVITDLRPDGQHVHVQRTHGDRSAIGWVSYVVLRLVEPEIVVTPAPNYARLINPIPERGAAPSRESGPHDPDRSPRACDCVERGQVAERVEGPLFSSTSTTSRPWNPTPEQIAGYW